MGLDGVELVMAFEEAFGIPIPDADAAKMFTPSDVIGFVEAHRRSGKKSPCLTRRAFHGIRERLLKMGFPRDSIRPGAPLAHFFPEKNRRLHWAEARGEYTVSQWPALVRPVWLQNLISIFPIVVAIATQLAASVYLRSPVSLCLVLAGCSALVTWYSLRTLTRSQCKCFPAMSTIHDLAMHLPSGGFDGLLRRD